MTLDFYSIGWWFCVIAGILLLLVGLCAIPFMAWSLFDLVFRGYGRSFFEQHLPEVPALTRKSFRVDIPYYVQYLGFCYKDVVIGLCLFSKKKF